MDYAEGIKENVFSFFLFKYAAVLLFLNIILKGEANIFSVFEKFYFITIILIIESDGVIILKQF